MESGLSGNEEEGNRERDFLKTTPGKGRPVKGVIRAATVYQKTEGHETRTRTGGQKKKREICSMSREEGQGPEDGMGCNGGLKNTSQRGGKLELQRVEGWGIDLFSRDAWEGTY